VIKSKMTTFNARSLVAHFAVPLARSEPCFCLPFGTAPVIQEHPIHLRLGTLVKTYGLTASSK
jgi:hypothetical protein